MFISRIRLAILAIGFSLLECWARPADIVARVPSNFDQGTKWILFRDNSIPDPPPNIIQAEDGVQVLPTYRHNEHQNQYQGYSLISPVSFHVPSSPLHVKTPPTHVVHRPMYVQDNSFHASTAPVNEQDTSFRATPVPVHVLQDTSFDTTPAPIHVEDSPLRISPTVSRVEATSVHVTHAPVHVEATVARVVPTPFQVAASNIHLDTSPIVTNGEQEVIIGKQRLTSHQPYYQFDVSNEYDSKQHGDHFDADTQHHRVFQNTDTEQVNLSEHNPVVKIKTFKITTVPQSVVHIQEPTYFDYLRKKKNA